MADFSGSHGRLEDYLRRTEEAAQAETDRRAAEEEARRSEFETRSFRLFGNDHMTFGESVSLAEVIAQLPAGVGYEDVTLEYAGCGSHDVDVSWPARPEDAPSGEVEAQNGD